MPPQEPHQVPVSVSKTSQARKVRIHWRAPLTIIVSLLVALLSAACHHLLYSLLDQTEVSDQVLRQQVVVASGFTLALIFRASLSVGLVNSYQQTFWWFVHRRALDFSILDSLAGFTDSLFDLIDYRAVLYSPTLVLLAAIIWLMPIASIVPPATISVGRDTVTTTSSQYLDTINYEAETLAKYSNGYVMNEIDSQTWFDTAFSWYGQPSNQLLRTTKATALQGYVPHVRGEHANVTYELKFNGPSVNCKAIDPDILKDWNAPLMCDIRTPSPEESQSCPLNFTEARSLKENRLTYMYIGWLPDDENIVPFGNGSLKSPTLPDTRGSLGSYRGGPVSIFAASRLDMKSNE